MTTIPENVVKLQHMDESLGEMRRALKAIEDDLERTLQVIAQVWGEGHGGPSTADYYKEFSDAKEKVKEANTFLFGTQATILSAVILMKRADG